MSKHEQVSKRVLSELEKIMQPLRKKAGQGIIAAKSDEIALAFKDGYNLGIQGAYDLAKTLPQIISEIF
jgi:hypothetical protein